MHNLTKLGLQYRLPREEEHVFIILMLQEQLTLSLFQTTQTTISVASNVNKNLLILSSFREPSYRLYQSILPKFLSYKMRISLEFLLGSFIFRLSIEFQGENKLPNCRKTGSCPFKNLFVDLFCSTIFNRQHLISQLNGIS